MMRTTTLLVMLLGALCALKDDKNINEPTPTPTSTTKTPSNTFAVVAYLPEWRYEGANWKTMCETLTHLILFSVEVSRVGKITALDRIPRPTLLDKARKAAADAGTHLLLCVGGNGRSNGFPYVVSAATTRRTFINELVALCEKYGFAGVDLNWEYPGFQFGRGYDDAQTKRDYEGFFLLLEEMSAAFKPLNLIITLAYYPDERQETYLAQGKAHEHVSFMHMMTYDQRGEHSTVSFAKAAVKQALRIFPSDAHEKLTLGLPFYARNTVTGEWKTYEDIVQQFDLTSLTDEVREVGVPGSWWFNGKTMIREKTKYALQEAIGGVMIWEVGQDCRVVEVRHHDREGERHQRTCPNGRDDSLLYAISDAIAEFEGSKTRSEL